MKLLLSLLLVLAAAPAHAADAGEKAALDRAVARGKLIYEYDQAAWLSTDAMVAKLPETEGRKLRGWVIESRAEGGLRVTYYGLDGDEPFAIYTADYQDGRIVSDHVVAAGENSRLSPLGVRLMRAKQAAAAVPRVVCGKGRPNTVTLPPQTPGDVITVYTLSPQDTTDRYPFGGYSKVEVGADGKLGATREFTRGCGDLELQAPAGGKTAALMVSHLLDPQPTEIHVFISLTVDQPLYVVTGERLWAVEGLRIREIDRASGDGK